MAHYHPYARYSPSFFNRYLNRQHRKNCHLCKAKLRTTQTRWMLFAASSRVVQDWRTIWKKKSKCSTKVRTTALLRHFRGSEAWSARRYAAVHLSSTLQQYAWFKNSQAASLCPSAETHKDSVMRSDDRGKLNEQSTICSAEVSELTWMLSG